MKHKITPLVVKNERTVSLFDSKKHGQVSVIMSNGEKIAILSSHEDAEFIARAVNSYDELVEALIVLTNHAKEIYPHFESDRGKKDIKRALNALELAKGK